jgi:hypothetical protein
MAVTHTTIRAACSHILVYPTTIYVSPLHIELWLINSFVTAMYKDVEGVRPVAYFVGLDLHSSRTSRRVVL